MSDSLQFQDVVRRLRDEIQADLSSKALQCPPFMEASLGSRMALRSRDLSNSSVSVRRFSRPCAIMPLSHRH